ncbi:MAG TPA: hypothetical protein PLQ56_16495 [Aggregatilineales bacterium]|nr:hypothetical protein [Aggregatilineales bacterium]
MLRCQRQNYHHSKLPAPGAIGHIVGLSTVNSRRKCMVIAYPLCDSAIYRGCPMSYGIHTIWVRFLDNGELSRFSGFWFQPDLVLSDIPILTTSSGEIA